MILILEITLFVIIIFIAAFLKSSIGFGNAIIAMPLLALTIGLNIAVPLVAIISLVISIIVISKDWRLIDLKIVWRLIASSLIGIPIGLLILKNINESIIKCFLAVLIILFSIYNLLKPKFKKFIENENAAFIFGFITGIIGGAYNTIGPPIAIYGNLKKWPPNIFRASILGYYLPTGLFTITGHYFMGFWTNSFFNYLLLSIPITIIAIILGNLLNNKINKELFRKIINYFLIFIGLILLSSVIYNNIKTSMLINF